MISPPGTLASEGYRRSRLAWAPRAAPGGGLNAAGRAPPRGESTALEAFSAAAPAMDPRSSLVRTEADGSVLMADADGHSTHTAARALMMLQMAVEEMESLPRDARMRLSDHNDLGEYVGDLSSRLQWLADGDDDEAAPVVSAQHPKGVKRMSQPYIVGPRPGTAGSARSSTHERAEETKAADGGRSESKGIDFLDVDRERRALDGTPASPPMSSSPPAKKTVGFKGSPRPGDSPKPEGKALSASAKKTKAKSQESGLKSVPAKKDSTIFNFTSVDQLKTIFNEVDINGDGQLDPTELQKVFEKCGRDFITESVITEFIDDFDNDGNGQLSFGEFVKVWNSTATHPVLMQAMRDGVQELARAPKKKIHGNSWMVLHPHAPVHADWELWITLMLVLTLVLLPLTLAFEQLACSLFYLTLSIDAFFVMDIIKQFNTGFVDENTTIVMSRYRISVRYLKSLFLFDLVSSFPYDVISWGDQCKATDQRYARAARLLKLVRLFRIMKLFRLLRFSKTFTMLRNLVMHYEDRYHVVIPESLIKMTQLLLMLLIGAHWIGCIQFMIVATAGFPRDSWVRFAKLEDAPVSRQYMWAYYKALAQMIVIGFETPAAVNQSCETVRQWCAVEHWLTLVALYFGAIFYSLLISNISMIVLSTNVGARTYRDKVQQVNEYMRSKSLPAALRDKVKDFYTVQYSEGKMFDEDKILRELSPSLRNEILAYNTRDLFSKVPLLFTAPENFVKAVVPTLTLSVGLEGEKMIHEHTTGDKMYFIYSGVCDITQGQGEHCTTIETIADGCYFGDCAVILGCQRTANVTTKTVSIVYSMSQVGLKSALELAPPDIIKYMKNVAKSRRDRMAHYRKFGRDGLDTSGLILDDQEDTKTEMYRDCLRQKMEIQLEMQEFEELGPDITTLAPPTITQRMSRFTLRSRPSQIGGALDDDRPSTPGGGRRITDFFSGRRQSMAVGNPRVHADDDGGDRPPSSGGRRSVVQRGSNSGLPNGRYSLTGEGNSGERRTSGTGIGGNMRRRETTVAGSRFKNTAKPPPHIARLRARQQANKKSRSSVAVKSVDDVAIFQRTLSQVVHTKKEDAEDEKISPLLAAGRRRTGNANRQTMHYSG